MYHYTDLLSKVEVMSSPADNFEDSRPALYNLKQMVPEPKNREPSLNTFIENAENQGLLKPEHHPQKWVDQVL